MRVKNHSRLVFGLTFITLLLIICRLLFFVPSQSPSMPDLPQITVLDPNGAYLHLGLEEFVIGVVAAEMPTSFAPAALAAQAVAARSYIAAHLPPYGSAKHGQAAVCCDPACCQAWRSEAERRQAWGEDFAAYETKITAAVQESSGMILLYDGSVAETPFYSCCGGATEDASDCWSKSCPYLVSVDCSWCQHATRFCAAQSFTLAEAAQLLGVTEVELRDMEMRGTTAGGRVAGVWLAGRVWRGTEVRSALGLNSAAFSWLIVGNNIVFATLGYGHGVGLCQYGADGMAQSGADYEQILRYYYPGTELGRLSTVSE